MGFAVERFDHIVLNCHDVDATASWYQRGPRHDATNVWTVEKNCSLLWKSENQPATRRRPSR
jgi:hypothetical protein